jgi:hypothetical protein
MNLISLLIKLNKIANKQQRYLNMPVVFQEPREEDYIEVEGAVINDGKIVLTYGGRIPELGDE